MPQARWRQFWRHGVFRRHAPWKEILQAAHRLPIAEGGDFSKLGDFHETLPTLK